jgi:hypothetical protein
MTTNKFIFGLACACIAFAKLANAQTIHQKVYAKQISKTPSNPLATTHRCGTEASPTDINYLNSIRNSSYEDDFIRDFNQGFRNMPIIYVPIKAHVVRTSTGTGGLSTAQLNAAMTTMNSYYINANMQFYLCGSINYIDNNTYFNFNQTDEAVLTAANDVSTNINIYFMNSVTSSGGSGLCGYAYFPGGPNHIMMANNCATNGSTLSHEVGHFYALYHTHGKTNTGTTDELVDGSNCTTNGDDVCDTPADPNLSGLVSTSCVYTGSATDANGDTFVPDPNNIMSYSRKVCRTIFSAGQYARINSTAVNSPSRNNYSCPSSADDAGIAQILNPPDGLTFCENPLTPQVIMANYSASTMTSATINYQINNGALTSLSWTGSLGPGATDTVSLASFVPPVNAVFDFKAFTSNPNGNTDNNYANDTLSSTTQYITGSNLPYAESLNAGALPTSLSSFDQSADGFEWSYSSTINGFGLASGGSVLMDNFTNDTRNTFDWLFVELLDLSSATNAQLFFDVAYAKYNASFSDTLIIAINDDCGNNYTPIYFKGGSDLATAPDQTSLFSPLASQWRTDTVDISVYDGASQIRIAFINKGGYGQPVHLDNINVKSAVICNLSTTSTVNDVSCNGGNDGSVTINASGSSSYSYDIGNGTQASNNFSNLSSGNYTLTISDGLGCLSFENINVAQPAPLVSNSSATSDVSCFGGSDGSFSLSTSGGTANYSYNLGNGSQNTATFSGLNAAAYTVTITDANNCTATTLVSVAQPASLLTVSLNSSTNVNCNGGSDGSLSLIASGGTASYSYDIGSGPQTSNSFNNLSSGNYTLTVSDANGCTSTQAATITQPNLPLNATTTTLNNLSCFGDSTGAFSVNASGGTTPYSYNLGTGNQSNNQFSNLSANNYTLTITDNNGCIASSTALISGPAAALLASVSNIQNVRCNGLADASLLVNATGGTSGYSYNLGNGAQSSGQFNNLAPANYQITVTDINNCASTVSVLITEPSILNLSLVDNGNNSASAIASGGTAPYTYLWDANAANQSTATATGLAAGNYCLSTTDANSCSINQCINIVVSSIDLVSMDKQFKVFPNPSTGDVTIQLERLTTSPATIQIINVLGQSIFNRQLEHKKIELTTNLSRQASGVYWVQVQYDKLKLVRKLILLK